jgi:hypothetical protein
MTDAAMWSLIVGGMAPPFIALIQQPTWPSWLRAIMTVLVCVVLGLFTTYFGGDLAGRSEVSAILLVLVAAWSSYGRFWKPLGVAGSIERATSPSGLADSPALNSER